MFWEVMQVELAIFIFIVLCVGLWHITQYLNWKHDQWEHLWRKFINWRKEKDRRHDA